MRLSLAFYSMYLFYLYLRVAVTKLNGLESKTIHVAFIPCFLVKHCFSMKGQHQQKETSSAVPEGTGWTERNC